MPRGYQAVMPYLRVRDAASAIKFYKKVFGATERFRLRMAGKIGHAELELAGCIVMLSDEFPEVDALGPKALKGTSVSLTVYVDNVDQIVAKAVKAGAKIRRPAADQFYGDRTAQIEDPSGHVWSIQTRIEKVNPKDMQKRLNTLLKAEAAAAIARRASGRGAKRGGGKKALTAKPAASGATPAKRSTTRKAAAGKAATGTKTVRSKAMVTKAAGRKTGAASRPKRAAKT